MVFNDFFCLFERAFGAVGGGPERPSFFCSLFCATGLFDFSFSMIKITIIKRVAGVMCCFVLYLFSLSLSACYKADDELVLTLIETGWK